MTACVPKRRTSPAAAAASLNQAKCRSSSFWCLLNEPSPLDERRCSLQTPQTRRQSAARRNLKWRDAVRSAASSGRPCRQVTGFAGFLALRALALTALCGVAGRITVGRPAGLTAASRGSGSGLNCARQGGESWDFLATMQAVTRPTSGISELHSRNASPVQACSCSGLALSGGGRDRNRQRRRPAASQTKNSLLEKSSSIPPAQSLAELWVNGSGFASTGGQRATAQVSRRRERQIVWCEWVGPVGVGNCRLTGLISDKSG